MSFNHGIYVLDGDDGDEWVTPRPVDEVVVDAVAASTDLERGDLDAIDAYADLDEVAAVVADGDRESVTFPVEGHEVTLTREGDVSVA
ncbi:HalOD1 output domain-containing protein [Halomicrobium urmianum]|uniref:HalOD1 output domain-containing protein n=1 Tax=Halomicrobium urmianum TaxID=1586233 RepID=UPI001CD9E8EF|nr:HalOD1 output domain-containing protein [Halomicrobium urmianum]